MLISVIVYHLNVLKLPLICIHLFLYTTYISLPPFPVYVNEFSFKCNGKTAQPKSRKSSATSAYLSSVFNPSARENLLLILVNSSTTRNPLSSRNSS